MINRNAFSQKQNNFGFILLTSCCGLNVSAQLVPGAGTYNLNGGAPYSNVFISKLDSNGDFVWQNDFFFIQYIDALEATKNNKVSIYNRWGDEVFNVSNYNNNDKVFKGLTTTEATFHLAFIIIK